ncbi:hypothetical protein STIAU_3140, partial [Stigmatella aurantiaca DW4/3-1]
MRRNAQLLSAYYGRLVVI